MIRALVVATAFLLSTPALACGGGDGGPLFAYREPADVLGRYWLHPDSGYYDDRLPLTYFLTPLYESRPETFAPLYNAVYGGISELPSAEGTFWAALAAGDESKFHAAAAIVVAAGLDRPALLAPTDDEEFRSAVEYLELESKFTRTVSRPDLQTYFGETCRHAPGFGFCVVDVKSPLLNTAKEVHGISPAETAALLKRYPTHPRAASLRLKLLQESLRTKLPNGWNLEQLGGALAPENSKALFEEIDAWLTDFPNHPLVDYVRLYKLRILTIEGEPAAIWRMLLAEYPKHPGRIAGEMRYIAKYGPTVPAFSLEGLPGELVATFLPYHTLTEKEWNKWWAYSESHAKEGWAVPLQEQLLIAVLDNKVPSIPSQFPKEAAAPTPEWAMLRLAILSANHQPDAAWKQSELCTTGPYPEIRAQIRLARQDLLGAIVEPGLSEFSADYLIRIEATDADLETLVKSEIPAIRDEAKSTLAARIAAKGDWKTAAAIAGKAWDGVPEAAAAAKTDPLAWARFMQSKRMELFTPGGKIHFYRAVGSAGSESTWIQASFEDYYALQAYAAALGAIDDTDLQAHPEIWLPVVKEADRSYNYLLNFGSVSGPTYWSAVIVTSPEAQTIRHAGKITRAATAAEKK